MFDWICHERPLAEYQEELSRSLQLLHITIESRLHNSDVDSDHNNNSSINKNSIDT